MDAPHDPPQPLDATIPSGALPAAQSDPSLEPEATIVGSHSEASRLLGAADLSQMPADMTQVPPQASAGESFDVTLVGGTDGPSAAPVERKVLSSRFEILGLLGQGGMGKVYRARDLQIEGRQVALKVLHPQYSKNARFRELFFQEIRAAQGFVSQYAAQIRDTGQMEDGSLFLTMDLVSGEPLARKLRREGALTLRHAFEITRQILLGLHSGHEKGLVHRDVKPSNVMLAGRVSKTAENPFGVAVRLLDFGIAGLIEDQPQGGRTGTPRYMSPEQVQGQRLDARSDLFAVGVVLFEMLTGTRPFEGETLEHLETSIIETRIAPLVRDLQGLGRPVKRILVKALRKDREKRYQSAREFLKAIERARVLQPEGRMGILPWVGLGLLTTAAGAEATVILHQRDEIDAIRGESVEGLEELASLSLRVEERETELARLQERLSDQGDLATRVVDLQRDYDRLSEENGTLQRRNEDLARRATELGSTRFNELPSTKTAACFDEVLKRIDRGAGRSALDLLKNRSGQGVFTLAGADGRALVYSLAECAAALEAAERSDGVDLGRLGAAGALLAEVRDGGQAFLLEASSWLTVSPVGGAPVDRKASLVATIRGLARKLEALRELGASSQDAAWSEVTAGPDDQDPEAAFAHAKLYGVDSIGELVARYGAHLERTAVNDGGLDAEVLGRSPALAKWGTWLAGSGASLDSPAADGIRAFACARSWYVDRAEEPVFSELFLDVPAIASGNPHGNWRAQLALQIAMSRSDAYPLAPECSAVMRHTWSQSGASMWFLERLQGKTAEGWRVQRRIHDAAGDTTGRPQSYLVTRLGDAYFVEGTKGLDLRSAESSVRVGTLHLESPASLPDKPWSRALDLEAYTDEVRSGSIPCLVIQTSSMELWFSPRFGLVHELRHGVYERELVFYSAFR